MKSKHRSHTVQVLLHVHYVSPLGYSRTAADPVEMLHVVSKWVCTAA